MSSAQTEMTGFRNPDPTLTPTVYTAGLLQQSLLRLRRAKARQGLEIGVGGGYLMAALLQAGVERFVCVDILAASVRSTIGLLDRCGLSDRGQVHLGNMWDACADRRFDLVVANLPHFPLQSELQEDHPPTWSDGGSDGRALIDPFVQGLASHLEPSGVVLMTHNVFVGLDRTDEELHVADMD